MVTYPVGRFEVAVQVWKSESHVPAHTSPAGETVTRGSEEENERVGCGFNGLGTALFTERSTVAVIGAQSPAFNVNWVGDMLMEYTSTWPSLVPGWVLLLWELPQPASNPAKPIAMRGNHRFIVFI
jgi:hypothetical protein